MIRGKFRVQLALRSNRLRTCAPHGPRAAARPPARLPHLQRHDIVSLSVVELRLSLTMCRRHDVDIVSLQCHDITSNCKLIQCHDITS